MLVCDRCESKTNVTQLQSISAKIGNSNNTIVEKPVDLCPTCYDSLKREIHKHLQPLDKVKLK